MYEALESTLINQTSVKLAQAIFCSALNKSMRGDYYYLGPSYLDPIIAFNNNVTRLFDASVLNATFYNLTKQATIVNYAKSATRPILIFTLRNDSLVSPLNARNFLEAGINNTNLSKWSYNNSDYRKCIA